MRIIHLVLAMTVGITPAVGAADQVAIQIPSKFQLSEYNKGFVRGVYQGSLDPTRSYARKKNAVLDRSPSCPDASEEECFELPTVAAFNAAVDRIEDDARKDRTQLSAIITAMEARISELETRIATIRNEK